MACITPDKILKWATPSGDIIKINQKLIPDDAIAIKDVASYIPKGGLMKPCKTIGPNGIPLGITIHNTPSTTSKLTDDIAELYTFATWPNCNMGGVAVHFYVYKDSIWQNLSIKEQGYHARDGISRGVKTHNGARYIGGNLDTIAIEVVGSDAKTEETAAKLCAYLCKRFSFDPMKDVYTHNYFMHKQGDKIIPGADKNCPYYILPHWSKFLESVDSFMKLPIYVVNATKEVSKDKLEAAKGALIAQGYSVSYTKK